MIAACLSVTYPRSQVVEFTVQFEDDPISLLIPYPELDNFGTIDAIIKPFQYKASILIYFKKSKVIFLLYIDKTNG